MKKRKNILKSSILCGLFCLLLSANGWSKDGKLSEISKPYLGTYECESFYLGSEDKLGDYDYIRIELSPDGEMKLSYAQKNKAEKTIPLTYEYDYDTGALTVYAKFGLAKTDKKFTLKDGEITASFSLGKYNVCAKFKR